MARVSTIPAGMPFVDALAAGLLAEVDGDALALADMLVLLPNRRACRSLRDAFWKAGAGAALALPAIQPIGDLDPDEILLDAETELDLRPAIGGLRRRLLLTRLLSPLGWTAHQASRLADDLASLLDELQTERVPFDALDKLVPDKFAAHWQKSLEILQVVGRHWPAVLEDEQAIDPAERRHRILSAIAERWVTAPPAKRIVAAGSTGSIPATRDLLRVIADLPAGEVVLPGLDQDLDEPSWQTVTPQHPQYGLKQLLAALETDRTQVNLWPQVNGRGRASRRRLLSLVMRSSTSGGSFTKAASIEPTAYQGLTLAEHPDPAAEAMAITLRLRAALLEEDRTAALITPDRALARRVVIELRRFGIDIDDSAGMPLDRTAPGSLLLLTAKLIIDQVRPVALLAVLKHPLTRAGLGVDDVRRRARALERRCLRGPAIVGGFNRILDALNDLRQSAEGDETAAAPIAELRDWLETLAELARPFSTLAEQDQAPLGALIEAHLRFCEGLAEIDGSAEALWAKEAGEEAAALFKELLTAADEGDVIAPAGYPAMLADLMIRRPVRQRRQSHARLFIWGQLEARLQQTDLMILAGLNEGVWPSVEEPGPWLNPSMRESLGLPPLERRIGQAAHDIVQLAAAGEVVLSRAEKDLDGSPTVPSRWVVRLKALLEGAAGGDAVIREDEAWQSWASSLDFANDTVRPEGQPRPKPPLSARPRTLPVSDIGLWMKNPYGLYAKRILHLKPLEPLEADPGAADRGTLIHEVLERFVREHPRHLPPDAKQRLLSLGVKAFAEHRHRPLVQAIWWPRFAKAVDWALQREAIARAELDDVMAEIKGELVIEVPAGTFTLTARADRLERKQDGAVTVVDYKTGGVPSRTDMRNGRAPQLPLEGVILQEGGFGELGALPLAGLQYWRLSGNEDGGELVTFADSITQGALDGLRALIEHYDRETTTYPASYRPPTARREDYDHLARLGEWPN